VRWQISQRVTGSWVTLTGKRRDEDELLIWLYDASPTEVILPCAAPNALRAAEEWCQSGSVEDGFGTWWLLPACRRGRPYDGIMHSDAVDVDSYLTQVPGGPRAVLTGIRDACRRLLAGYAESMSYGMPDRFFCCG
jgi:hypothetical protein